MAYEGTVDLISGIRPKNNQNFPLVNAKDVYVDDSHRLTDTLEGLEGSFVRYDAAQTLSDGEKTQALVNVGGASEQDVNDLKEDLTKSDGYFIKRLLGEKSADSLEDNNVIYFWGSSATVSNIPTGVGQVGAIFNWNGGTSFSRIQLYFDLNTNAFYTRTLYNQVWSEWSKIARQNAIDILTDAYNAIDLSNRGGNIHNILTTNDLCINKSSRNFQKYGEKGYINVTGTFVPNNNYTIYYYLSPINDEIWFEELSSNTDVYQLCTYNGELLSTDMDYFGTTTHGTLPSENNKLSIKQGQYIAIAIYSDNDFVLHTKLDMVIKHSLLENDETISLFNDIFIEGDAYQTLDNTSELFTTYETRGYINIDTGNVVTHDKYTIIWMVANKTGEYWFSSLTSLTSVYQLCVYRDALLSSDGLIFASSSSRGTLPKEDNKVTINEGDYIAVSYYNGQNFALEVPTKNTVINSKYDDIFKRAVQIAPIIIKPIDSNSFDVKILSTTNMEYITHRFIREYQENTLSYGDGLTKQVVCEDVWYSNYIYGFNGERIMQGNTNFIHYIANKGDEHRSHVGAGHGCCVSQWTQFWADGMLFDPMALSEQIECSVFRMVEKVEHYLNDYNKSVELYPSTYSAHAIPSLDSDGNPIKTGTEYLDGEWSVNNRVRIRNRFDIEIDDVQFNQCHAGMNCGFYPYFTDVMINSSECIWTHTHSDDYTGGSDREKTFINIDLGGSGTVLAPSTTTKFKADEVVLFGEHYRVTKRILDNNPLRVSKLNVMMWMPPSGDGRLKAYMMPCICTQSAKDSGESVETFNTGDRFDTIIEMSLDVG